MKGFHGTALKLEERSATLIALRGTPIILAALLHGRRDPELRAATAGSWSVEQAVAHLAAIEERLFDRTRRICEEDDPELVSIPGEYDPELRLDLAHAHFVRRRREHLAYLENLSDEAWDRVGHHRLVGSMSLLVQAQGLVLHDVEHLSKMAHLLTS